MADDTQKQAASSVVQSVFSSIDAAALSTLNIQLQVVLSLEPDETIAEDTRLRLLALSDLLGRVVSISNDFGDLVE